MDGMGMGCRGCRRMKNENYTTIYKSNQKLPACLCTQDLCSSLFSSPIDGCVVLVWWSMCNDYMYQGPGGLMCGRRGLRQREGALGCDLPLLGCIKMFVLAHLLSLLSTTNQAARFAVGAGVSWPYTSPACSSSYLSTSTISVRMEFGSLTRSAPRPKVFVLRRELAALPAQETDRTQPTDHSHARFLRYFRNLST
jgi:hypothetical protein